MELDQSHLQLIFNVIAITAVTSLGTVCFLLKRENEELTNKLNFRRELALRRQAMQSLQTVSGTPQDFPVESEQEAGTAPALERDIREFVTKRAQGWVAPSQSQWKMR